MMRVMELALKDLRQVLRERRSALFLLLMPIAFTFFLGMAFGQGSADRGLPVAWLNRDGGLLGDNLHDLLARSGTLHVAAAGGGDTAAVEAMVNEGRVAAAVIVPERFTERTLAGEAVPVEVVIKPGSATGQNAAIALQAVIKRALSAAQIARLSAAAREKAKPFTDDAQRQLFVESGLARAVAARQDPPLTVRMEAVARAPVAASKFAQSSPGMLVQFAVFGLITSALVLVIERKAGTMQRLLTTPITPAGVIAGHLLAMFLVVFVQECILVLLGQVVFKVDYLREPVATLVMMGAVALWSASLGMLIGALARGEEQVVLFCLIAMFAFSALGGAWFPLEATSETFSAIGHLTPGAWAMEGFQNIVLRQQGLGSIWRPAGALTGYAVLFSGVAIWRFRFA